MIDLACLYGTGDTYLVSALAQAVEQHHGDREVELIVKSQHACIPEMFGLRYRIDDRLIAKAEKSHAMHLGYDNMIGGGIYYVHPHFVRSGVRIDHLTVKPSVSQADMYRALLHLPPDAPLAVPHLIHQAPYRPRSVLLIPEARSWPNDRPAFWQKLATALNKKGWWVLFNEPAWPLKALLDACLGSEWVIGPQCGVMAILCAAQFPCRKTIATPSVDGGLYPGLPVDRTFPYAYVTKFTGQDYDVEEFKIIGGDEMERDLVDQIVNGANARRLWPHDPRPVETVDVPLTPGDFLDRLAVLIVKHHYFSPDKKAALTREHDRYLELYASRAWSTEATKLFDRLLELHQESFQAIDRYVQASVKNEQGTMADHAAAVRSNRERVLLKQQIDAVCRAPYTEVKGYFNYRLRVGAATERNAIRLLARMDFPPEVVSAAMDWATRIG